MEREKRETTRRKSDLLIRKTIRLNRTLIDLLLGQKGELGFDLNRIRSLELNLGRREEDRKAAVDYLSSQERIAQLLIKLGIIEKLPRRIRLTKLKGAIIYPFPPGTVIVGWEYKPPRHSDRYMVYLESGLRFRTSTVLGHGDDYLQTAHSFYKLDVLDEPYMGRTKQGLLESATPITSPTGPIPRRSAYASLKEPPSPSISRSQ